LKNEKYSSLLTRWNKKLTKNIFLNTWRENICIQKRKLQKIIDTTLDYVELRGYTAYWVGTSRLQKTRRFKNIKKSSNISLNK
jgi:hypothetical protein